MVLVFYFLCDSHAGANLSKSCDLHIISTIYKECDKMKDEININIAEEAELKCSECGYVWYSVTDSMSHYAKCPRCKTILKLFEEYNLTLYKKMKGCNMLNDGRRDTLETQNGVE